MRQLLATPELMQAIKEGIESLDYGTITIKVNKERDCVDLLIEQRERFPIKRKGKILEVKTENKFG